MEPFITMMRKVRRLSGRGSRTLVSVVTLCLIIVVTVVVLNSVPVFMRGSASDGSSEGETSLYDREGNSASIKNRHISKYQLQNGAKMKKFKSVWNSRGIITDYTAEPKCTHNATLQIFITSSPANADKRNAIRRTWCSKPTAHEEQAAIPQFQCVFLIGETGSEVIDPHLEQELTAHDDILRGIYIDSYKNLTYKVLSAFHWSTEHCPSKFILKTDDDCFVNRKLLLYYLHEHHQNSDEIYVGAVHSSFEDTQVIRSPYSKWAVSKESYKPDNYPPYASGTGYLISQDVLQSIVGLAEYLRPFPNEDAYIGVLVSQSGVTPVHSFRFTFYNNKFHVCNFSYMFVIHHVLPQGQSDMYKTAGRVKEECRGQKIIKTWS